MTSERRPEPNAGKAEAQSDAQLTGQDVHHVKYDIQTHLNLIADARAGLADVSAGRSKDARAALAHLRRSRTLTRS